MSNPNVCREFPPKAFCELCYRPMPGDGLAPGWAASTSEDYYVCPTCVRTAREDGMSVPLCYQGCYAGEALDPRLGDPAFLRSDEMVRRMLCSLTTPGTMLHLPESVYWHDEKQAFVAQYARKSEDPTDG